MILNAYYPKPFFPPISISECVLMCKHCMGNYLKGMEQISKPENLISYCKSLEKKGGKGILVSGGCNESGEIINLRKMTRALKKIKEETNLIIAIHPGFVDDNLANEIAEACHIAFVDVIGSEETAHEVIGLKEAMGIDTLKNLIEAGISVTPHITIGLHYGKIVGEYDALKIIKKFSIKRVVLNIICKTKNTPFEEIKIPPIEQIKGVMREAKGMEVALGCMRPRSPEIEKMAIDLGVVGIAVPSKKAMEYAINKGYKIQKIPACCGITKAMVKSVQHGKKFIGKEI